MGKFGFLNLILMGMVAVTLVGLQFSCTKKQSPQSEEKAQESLQIEENPVADEKKVAEEKKVNSAASEKATGEPEKDATPPEQQEETAEAGQEDDEDVDNVKEAFQYTGKKMDKGLKKSGKSIKKFFVGDDKDE